MNNLRDGEKLFTEIIPVLIPFIKRFEGFSEKRYICPGGKLTIGYGHVIRNDEVIQDEITEEFATKLLELDAKISYDQLLKTLPITIRSSFSIGKYCALIDFIFNLGIGNFTSSTLCKVIKEEQFLRVPTELMRWVYAGDKILKGLQRRRIAEIKLWDPFLFKE